MRSEDIARLAGVSRSTVSRVINSYPNVPEETRRKVMKVIEEHQYEPNTSARVLAGKGTDTIGLFIVSTSERPDVSRIYDNSYFARFVDAVVEHANTGGSYVLIHTVYSRADFLKVKQAFLQKRIDGGIIVGTGTDSELIRELVELESPLVLIDYDIGELTRNRLDRNHLSVVNTKDYEGAMAVMKHLIELGHRDIGMLCGNHDTYSGRERYKAYEDAMNEAGYRIRSEWVLRGGFLKHVAYEEAERLAASGAELPTALFAANDDMAFSAMKAFAERGIRVPEELSVVGYDDVPAASLLTPGLTTVRMPIYDISRAAVESIGRLRKGGSSSFGTISFPTELVIRQSTQRCEE